MTKRRLNRQTGRPQTKTNIMRTIRPAGWLLFLGILVGLSFVVLSGWLWRIQVRDHERWAALAADNAQQAITRVARRGDILDIRGTPLAISVPAKTVCADPSLIYTQRVEVAQLLAPLLGMDAGALFRHLEPRCHTNAFGRRVTNSFVLLKHQVALDQWRRITNAMAGLRLEPKPKHVGALWLAQKALRTQAIFGVDEPLRQYPSQTLAAQVLGYVASSEVEGDHGRAYEIEGLGGIEKRFDALLNGQPGWRSPTEDVAPRPGLNVVLTLDAGVQAIVEEELAKVMTKFKPRSVFGLVVRRRTGEILAMANLPTFDPNQPGTNLAAFYNHVISDAFEPGSTFKIVTIGTALNDGKITLDEQVFCENGYWAEYGLNDSHHGYGLLTFELVLAKSSNIGTAKAALRLGATRLYNTVTNFGFGWLTGIPLPDESRGRIAHPRSWDGKTISRVPIGQSIMATPLQTAMAMAAVANGGELMQPFIVARIEDEQHHVIRRATPTVLHRVLSPAAARDLVQALKSVASEEGTGKAAQLDYYTAAGKTGTAVQVVNGAYSSSTYFSSFVGFFPADNPELCILVGVDRPDVHIAYYGATVAAPAFKAIAERVGGYLRIPPDLPSEMNSLPAAKLKTEPLPEATNRRARAPRATLPTAALAGR
jgi:cell division protein FtsI/penicillin-binding protein 2